MSHALTLQVPADAPFRALASEAAARVVTVCGGSAEHGEALRVAVAEAVAAVAGHGEEVTVTFDMKTGGVGVTIRCGSETRHVEHALSDPAH
jgi:hypothetical protein